MDHPENKQNEGDKGAPTLDEDKEKKTILRNVLLLSLAFLLNYLSVMGLGRLQSSLHKKAGLGVISTGFLFLVFTVTSLFVPNPLIAKIGYKWSMAGSFMCNMMWIAANGYAIWATMLPASALVGFAAGPMWTAQSSYLSLLAPRYAALTNANADDVLTKFFGVFFFFNAIGDVIGPMISSIVLSNRPANVSHGSTDFDLCGFNDCPYYNVSNVNLEKPPKTLIWVLVGVYLVITSCAVLVMAVFVDEVPENLKKKKPTSLKQSCALLMVTIKLFRQKEMLLLTPITAYIRIQLAFYSAEFTKSFVSCTIGIWMVGYFTIPYGVISLIMVITSSLLSKFIGRVPLMTIAALVDLASFLVMIFLHPHPDNTWVLIMLAGALGFSAGIWRLHYALYGIVFLSKPEPAFAARTTIMSLGAMTVFFYSNFICTSTKIFIVISLLFVSYLWYLTLEIMHRNSNKSHDLTPQEIDVAVVMNSDIPNKALHQSTESFKQLTQ